MEDDYENILTDEEEVEEKKPKTATYAEIKKDLPKIENEKHLIQTELDELKKTYEGDIKTMQVYLFGNPNDKRLPGKVVKLQEHLDDLYLKDIPAMQDIPPVMQGYREIYTRYKKLLSYQKEVIYKIGIRMDDLIIYCKRLILIVEMMQKRIMEKDDRPEEETAQPSEDAPSTEEAGEAGAD